MNKTNAIALGVSQYQQGVKVIDVAGSVNVLKRSVANEKLGKRKVWRSGAFKGMPLYSLTLEERATCASTCNAWAVCYGNNMPFAHRFDVTKDNGAALMARLYVELDKLDKLHPNGYSIRLHILGDFFSLEYVQFWFDQLSMRPALHIYGYTHRLGEIKEAINKVWLRFQARFNILQSDGIQADEIRPIALIETTDGADKLVTCPEQTGKAAGCLDCGLCTLPNFKGVRFLVH